MIGRKHRVQHSEHGHKKQRSRGDIVLALMFLFAILAVLLSHNLWNTERGSVEDDRETYAAVFRKEEALRQRESALRRAEIVALSEAAQGNSASSSFAQWEEPLLEGEGAEDFFSVPDASTASTSISAEDGPRYMRFEDVTATTYENKRLGFIMELPEGWNVTSEDSTSLHLSGGSLGSDTTSDTANTVDALWIEVTRPCTSQEGAVTQFVFASTSDSVVIREAKACIAPFLVTLGFRADAPDHLGRERFLLSIARTFYPIVSPYAPYAPIRP